MKKENKKTNLLAIILAIILIFIVIIGILLYIINKNGNSSSWFFVKTCNIGETTSNSNFEVTLKSVQFTDKINLGYASNGYGNSDFCLPTTKNDSSVIDSKENSIFLSYVLEYKYIGKSDYTGPEDNIGKPILIFDNDYTYLKNFMSAVNNGKNNEYWTILSSDISGNDKILHSSTNYRPLEDKTYTLRGFISIPEKLKDSDKSLAIKFEALSNNKFKIR